MVTTKWIIWKMESQSTCGAKKSA